MSVQSPKPRRSQPLDSAGSSSVPPSRPSSGGSRRQKRNKEKKKQDTSKAQNEPEAGPSVPSGSTSSTGADPGPSTRKAEGTFGDEDFIAFTFDDEDEAETEEEVKEVEPPVREWDKGKGKARDVESSGRKRKHDEVDLNDGYANKKQRMDALARKAPWAVDVDWDRCNNVAEMLHNEVEAFIKYISPTPIEDEMRSLIVMSISRAIESAFPDARVYPFGSYETKLYLPLGDIDLVIESNSMAYSNPSNVLSALAATMRRAGIADKVTIISKAKVPIIKFVTRHGRFPVDISINQINGVKAGKMVNRFLNELPALRGLVLITKSFLSQRSMNEVFTGGLGSYSIVCLAISFLQMHPKIRRGEIDPSKNLGVLVMEFFELYGYYFNYNEVGISVRDGGSYFNKAQRGWSDYRSPGLLSIEDPGDPSNDISKGSFGIARVRLTLAGAHGIMTAAAYMHANYISARKSGRRVDLHTQRNPEDMSILASVMGVTQETINHRRLVQELYDSRVLHKMLGVEPRRAPEPSTSPEQSTTSTRAAKESVRSAWEEADADHAPPGGREADEDDESRYGIDKRQPPKKRRKTGTQMDLHTVYTMDEDEEDEDGSEDEESGDEGDDGSESESGEELLVHTVESDEEEKELQRQEGEYDTTKSTAAEKRRSYWLSKGISM